MLVREALRYPRRSPAAHLPWEVELGDSDSGIDLYEYRLLGTKKTSTMQKELNEAGSAGFGFVGFTVSSTTFGGTELVSILRRRIGE